jgi:hypothetical protein
MTVSTIKLVFYSSLLGLRHGALQHCRCLPARRDGRYSTVRPDNTLYRCLSLKVAYEWELPIGT